MRRWRLVSSLCLLAGVAHPQAPNPQAVKWFELGMQGQTLDQKIAAYTKAVALDSSFVEALFNLGVALKQKQDYSGAEVYLRRAYTKKPARFELAIAYELATTYHRLGKTAAYEKILRQARQIPAEPKTQATIAFELGRYFYEQGRYEEALAELLEGQQLDSANAHTFTNLIQLAENDRELQRLYESAQQFKAKGDWQNARALFERVYARNPRFQNVAAELAALQARFRAEAADSSLAAMYQRALQHENEGRLELAIATYEKLLDRSSDFKEASAGLARARQQLTRQETERMLANEYAAGLIALEQQDWKRALAVFEKISALDPGYRDAYTLRAEAQNGLARAHAESLLVHDFAGQSAVMQRGDLAAAKPADLPEPQQEPEAAVLTASTAFIDSLQQVTQLAEARQDWLQAVVTLENLKLLLPDDQHLASRLNQARVRLAAHSKNEGRFFGYGGDRTLTIIGAVATVVILPLAGLILFMPAARARFYLLTGRHERAAGIYEKLLAHNAGRVALYPILARIYLFSGRTDAVAMKIYKLVLQLNLACGERDEIHALVRQHYLTRGKSNQDGNEVVEIG